MMIKKVYIQKLRLESLSIYNTFKQKKCSEHISSPIGIQTVLDIIEEVKPRHILEVGGGIGALSYTALKYSTARVDIFEDQPFCVVELKKNLAGFEDRYTLLTDYENFTLPHDSYDLVIIDGGGHAFVYHLINHCEHIGRIMVEGGRSEQRKQIRRALRERHLFRPVEYKDSSGRYKGAHQVFCYRNNSPFLRHLSYWLWEIIIFSEIKKTLTNRFKKLLQKVSV